VACPGFSSDCLETIDEIGHEAKELFLEKGGTSLTLIRCLNDEPQWLDALTDIVLDNLHGWILPNVECKQELNCDISCPARACGLTTFPNKDRSGD
jgi:ferrochelatase